jgi:hypothetical protein
MSTQDRVLLALSIFLLAAATAIEISHGRQIAVVTGAVLVLVVIVRLVVPGVRALRARRPD